MRGAELVRIVRTQMARRPGMLCAALLLTCTVILLLTTTCSQVRSVVAMARPPGRFFPRSAPVLDLYLGEEEQVQGVMEESDVTVIFYYAPWCAHSISAREHIQQVALRLHTQVQFVAVNCWWHQGRCRKQRNLYEYPLLHLYYRRFGPIHYKGPVHAEYVENFIRRVTSPLTYLPTSSALHTFLSHHQQGVVGFFEFNASPQPPGYLTFLASALHALRRDSQGAVRFAVVTNQEVAGEIVKKDQSVYLHRRFNSSLVFPRSERNFTPEAVCNWVFENRENVLSWIQLLEDRSHTLETELNKGPALFVFLPHSPFSSSQFLSEVVDVVLRYHACSSAHSEPPLSGLRCCRSLPLLVSMRSGGNRSVCELCVGAVLSGERWHCPAPQLHAALDSFLHHPAVPAAPHTCNNVRRHYAPSGLYSICCKTLQEGGVGGLNCQTNKTLRFYLLDARLAWPLARRLGATDNTTPLQPFTTIINMKDDTHYVLQEARRDTLEHFIVNFSAPFSPLHRHLVGSMDTHPSQSLIQEVTSHSFDNIVMNVDKDVLLYYYTGWCGFCLVHNHVLIRMAQLFHGNSTLLVARVNVAVNDLQWEFMVDRVPTFIFFPRYRKHMSVKFPESSRITLPNLVRFIFQHADTSSQEGAGPKALLEAELRSLQGEVMLLQRARESVSQQLVSLWRENRRLTRRTETLQSHNAELQEQSVQLETLYREKSRQLSDAMRRLQELADASDQLLHQNALLKVLLNILREGDGWGGAEGRGLDLSTEPDIS